MTVVSSSDALTSEDHVIERIYLQNTSGSHNKFYRLMLVSRPDASFQVVAQWGRIERPGAQSGIKWSGADPEQAAGQMHKLAADKMRGGYSEMRDPELDD